MQIPYSAWEDISGNTLYPIRPWYYVFTYPRGSKCPRCKSRLHYVIEEETMSGPNVMGTHWRLAHWSCPKGHYEFKGWI